MPGRPLTTCRGHGPALVLLHGWAMNSRCWGPLAERLSRHFSLHLVDLPGHGLAEPGAWEVGEVVDWLCTNTPPADWLGWSLGGSLALEAARMAPTQVRGLVLIGTNPRFVAGQAWPHAMPKSQFKAFREAFSTAPEATLEQFLALQVAGAQDASSTLRILRYLLAEGGAPDHRALDAGLKVLGELDLGRYLAGMPQQALWIAGDEDRLVPAVGVQLAAERMPNGRSLVISGAGHAPFLSHPEQVMGAIRGFLAREQAA